MNVFQKFDNILNWFTPAEFTLDPHVRKRVHMFLISHILGPIVASPIPIFLFLYDPHPWPHVYILSASIFGFWVFLALMKLIGHYYRPLAMLSIINFSFAILWGAYNYGGASSPFLSWFLVIPLVAFFYFGVDWTTRMFVFGQIAIGVLALYAAYLFGGSFPTHIPSDQLVVGGLVSVFSSATYVFFMASYYSSVVDSQSALLKEIDEHKQTLEKLRVSKDVAERASKAKSEFLAKMSHELRTPLNAVLGYTEILLEDAEIDGNGTMIADLNKISAAGKHLLAMVNDILDISKIEAGRMDLNLDTIDIDRMFDEIEHTARPLAAKNANQFRIERSGPLGTLRSDPTKVRQVILNLLSNASKFTQNGVITLKGETTERKGRKFVDVSVIDTGIGISEEQLAHLFSNFAQADAHISAVYGGTGLGLSLSQNLARLMGGEIIVTSTLNEGSTFTVTIPVDGPDVKKKPKSAAKPASGQAGNEETADQALEDAEADLKKRKDGFSGMTGHLQDHKSRPKVLVVDDDKAFLELAERTLIKLGYAPLCMADPTGAMHLCRTVKPAVVLVDILMPQMSGWDLLETLHKDTATASIPVIMLSVVDEKSMAQEKGAKGFLLKPLDPSKCERMLGSVVSVKPGKAA
ncbi:MAG: response regulator [Hyphomicrobiaceae bacterium]|nr:response regulator [Hyphomicrobiaceae bacterium]MCC0024949.1 response regulator [Hyphomicrobiaceae bacterium]